MIPFYRLKNRGKNSLDDLLKAAHLISYKATIHTQDPRLPITCNIPFLSMSQDMLISPLSPTDGVFFLQLHCCLPTSVKPIHFNYSSSNSTSSSDAEF